MSARKQRLIQSNLFHHHGIRAELSQRTFDFSTHDHHNQASRILTEVLSIWVQVKWIPVFVISFMKNKLVYLLSLSINTPRVVHSLTWPQSAEPFDAKNLKEPLLLLLNMS